MRANRFLLVILAAALLGSATGASAESAPPAAQELAKAYGLDSYDQIDAVRYTFNVDLPAAKVKLSRTWTWEPKTGRVSFSGKDKEGKPLEVSYSRNDPATQNEVVKTQVDPSFVNDQYWLLIPFHAVWDGGATVEDSGVQKLPIGNGSAKKITIKYSSGGYTPGDTWELYVGKDNRVQQMLFRHGGQAKPGEIKVTWAGNKKAGPLLVSTEHRGTADGKPFTVKFTNVAVRVAGSSDWTEAK